MNIETYVNECNKLINKYGSKAVSKSLLNEVWKNVKHECNQYIIDKVDELITTKPIDSKEFTIDDFLNKKKEINVINIGGTRFAKKDDTNYDLRPKRHKDNYKWSGLEEALSKLNANSLVEAINNIKKNKG